jgi:hypothetical protein
MIKIGNNTILNPKGYTEEQLNISLPERDCDFIEKGIHVPVDYGMGIEIENNGELYVMKRIGKPFVTLHVETWMGISVGAMHYYADLTIALPEMTRKDRNRYTRSCWDIPMFKRNKLELTQVLEQWEIDKYPDHYEYRRAGQRHDGFYTKKQIYEYAPVVFEQIFEKGWIFKIKER